MKSDNGAPPAEAPPVHDLIIEAHVILGAPIARATKYRAATTHWCDEGMPGEPL